MTLKMTPALRVHITASVTDEWADQDNWDFAVNRLMLLAAIPDGEEIPDEPWAAADDQTDYDSPISVTIIYFAGSFLEMEEKLAAEAVRKQSRDQ